MKQFIKKIIKKIPIAFTKNQQYDRDTKKIFQQILTPHSCCIDIGCHKGEVLDWMLEFAPQGKHFGFEPIPLLYEHLTHKYAVNKQVTLMPYALSNETGQSTFNHVISNPAYSGIRKRTYDNSHESDETIYVQLEKLDNLISSDMTINLIKIDVEGAEMLVVEGARQTIAQSQPYIIFEHGLGASDLYEHTPNMLFTYFTQLNYQIFTLQAFLKKQVALTQANFNKQFYQKINYYFIAVPKKQVA